MMTGSKYPNPDLALNLRNLGPKPTLAEVTKLVRKYKGWEAYAILNLWKGL